MKPKKLSYYLNLIKTAQEKRDLIGVRHFGELAFKKLSRLSHSAADEFTLYNRLGIAYSYLAEYSRALDFFYKAYLTGIRNHFSPADIAYTSVRMMDNLLLLRHVKQVRVQFKKVEQYFQKYGDKTFPMDEREFVNAHISIGYYYLYQKELDKLQEVLNKKLRPYQSFYSRGIFLIDYQHLKGEYLIEKGDYAGAEECFRLCISESGQIGFPAGGIEAKIHLAIIELLNGKMPAAVEIFKEIFKEAGCHKLNELICEIGIFLSKCYRISGLPEKAGRIELRIRPFLNKLDTIWLYEKNREVENLFSPKKDRQPYRGKLAEETVESHLKTNLRRVHPAILDKGWEQPAARTNISSHNILTETINRRHAAPAFRNIIGQSASMQEVFHVLEKIAPTNLPVLIQGETGTGKELIAVAIHQNSLRKDKTFLAFNCGAIPETLIESHLFGHTRGAFTGADESKKGYIELASGGTLFIDEISNMSPAMQQRLLRVLEEQMLRPIGSEKTVPVNTRFIFASNQNIEKMTGRGLFREDLFYRISAIIINLPPLRQRKDDIPLLINHFLRKYNTVVPVPPPAPIGGLQPLPAGAGQDNQPKEVSSAAMEIYLKYHWPGNIRELENEIQRILALYPDERQIIQPMLSESIHKCISIPYPEIKKGSTIKELKDDFEKKIIIESLIKYGGNLSEISRRLGYARRHLHRKIKQFSLNVRDYVT